MAITNYGELVDALVVRSKRSDIEATVIPDSITYAHQEINRSLRVNAMLATADLTVNAETISQPTGFLAFRSLYLDVTPRIWVTSVAVEQAELTAADYQSGTYPSVVAKQGSSLRFAPQFTGSATGKAVYYKAAADLAADGDTNVILTPYPFLYVWGALSDIFDYLEDDAGHAKYETMFRGLIDDLNRQDAKDAMSGPIQAMPYGGGIV